MRRVINWLKYLLLIFISIKVLKYLYMPFRGESTFTVTTLYYAILFFIPIAFVGYKKLTQSNALLLYLSIVFSLFCAEFTLRFIVKKPLTYSERQWGRYNTMYDSPYNKISFSEKRSHPNATKHYHLLNKNSLRDYKTPEFNYTKEYTNSLGLRGKLPSRQKKTIISLGDSFTESAGAPADSSYPVQLEKFISRTDTSTEVMNAGVSGSDPFFEFKLLQKLNKEYHFQTAIFLINSTDINDVMMRGDMTRFIEDGSVQYRKPPFWEPLYSISFVFRLVIHSLGYDYNLMKEREESAAKFAAVKSIVKLFKDTVIPWSKSEGINVKVALHPMRSEISRKDIYYKKLSDGMKKINIDYLDMRDSLINYKNTDKLYWAQDGHFNSLGYHTAARIIFNTFFKKR